MAMPIRYAEDARAGLFFRSVSITYRVGSHTAAVKGRVKMMHFSKRCSTFHGEKNISSIKKMKKNALRARYP
jgi:hypothetical protein